MFSPTVAMSLGDEYPSRRKLRRRLSAELVGLSQSRGGSLGSGSGTNKNDSAVCVIDPAQTVSQRGAVELGDTAVDDLRHLHCAKMLEGVPHRI